MLEPEVRSFVPPDPRIADRVLASLRSDGVEAQAGQAQAEGGVRRLLLSGAAMLALVASSAGATTIVLPKPGTFVADADVIAVGEVEKIESWDDNGTIKTRVALRVEDAKKGTLEGELLPIVELGGELPSGSLIIEGTPPYEVGERALVLLEKRNGTLRTSLLSAGRIPMESRWFGLASPMAAPDLPGREDWQADVASLALALPSRAGVSLAAPHALPAIPGAVERESARTMGARWRTSAPIPVHAPTVPDEGLGSAASDAAILAGTKAWTGAATTVRLELQPDRRTPAGFTPEPGHLLVSFNDPKNEIEDPRGCGGVLAIGGFAADGVTQADGLQTIIGAALVFNDGWGGCGFWSSSDYRNFSEVLAHELGHTIGLAHSCRQGESCDAEARAALMNWSASFDGRGATLQTHDRRSVLELYGPLAIASPSPTPLPNPTPASTPSAPPGPTAMPPTPPEPQPTPRRGCRRQTTGEALILFGVVAGVCVAARRRTRPPDVG